MKNPEKSLICFIGSDPIQMYNKNILKTLFYGKCLLTAMLCKLHSHPENIIKKTLFVEQMIENCFDQSWQYMAFRQKRFISPSWPFELDI